MYDVCTTIETIESSDVESSHLRVSADILLLRRPRSLQVRNVAESVDVKPRTEGGAMMRSRPSERNFQRLVNLSSWQSDTARSTPGQTVPSRHPSTPTSSTRWWRARSRTRLVRWLRVWRPGMMVETPRCAGSGSWRCRTITGRRRGSSTRSRGKSH